MIIDIQGTKFSVETTPALYDGVLDEDAVLARLRAHASMHFIEEQKQQALTYALAKLELTDGLDVVSVTKNYDWQKYIGCTVEHKRTGAIAIVASYNAEENHLEMTDMGISYADQWKPVGILKDLTGCLVVGREGQGIKIVKEQHGQTLYFTDHTSGPVDDYDYIKKVN